MVVVLLGVHFVAGAGACGPQKGSRNPAPVAALGRYEFHQVLMGVDTKLVVYSKDESTAAEACRAAFERVAELEDAMSDYRPTSELMRLCAKAGGLPVKVSEDLFRVLSFGQRIARESDGAFDMTVGPLVQLWRAARKSGVLPDDQTLARARELVGYEKLVLDAGARTARLARPGMRLDLGGIAKGDAGDQALSALRERGISRALFQAGGDIVLGDPPPGAAGWKINLPHPPAAAPVAGWRLPLQASGTPDESTVVLANCAISTSGDSNQFVEIGGTRYSHLLDPRTGLGLTSRTVVTVVAPKGLVADPLSKAASLLPAAKLHSVASRHPGTVVYVRRSPLGAE